MRNLRRYLSIFGLLATITSTGAFSVDSVASPPIESMQQALMGGRFGEIERIVAQAQADYENDTTKESVATQLLKSFAMPDPALEERLDSWVDGHPSYAAHAMRGDYRISMAHAWRGYGWSRDVSPARFEQMNLYLKGAYEDLDAATKLTAKPSFAFARLIDVAKLIGNRDLARDILGNAEKADPYAVGPYFAYAAMLVPRWGGSYDEMEALANRTEQMKHRKLLLLAKEIRHNIQADRANLLEHREDRLAALKGYQDANALVETAESLCRLGRLYTALGQLDNAMAALNRALSLEPNNDECLFQRAELKLGFRQPAEGISDLRRAALFGHPTATRNLGIILFDGERGVPINTEEGLNWLNRAAYFWDTEALFQLGLIHERGQGITPNLKLASEYYHYCANLGDVRCEVNFGMMLWYGNAVPADHDQAIRLWHRAARKGAWQGGHNLNYFLSPAERIRVVFTLGPGMWASQLIATIGAILIGGLAILWILFRRRKAPNQATNPEEPAVGVRHSQGPLLAFNTVLPQTMLAKYQVGIGALPLGLMFASFIPLFHLASWLETAKGSILKSAPTGALWIAAFLVAMVALMLIGYALGWLANAAIARLVFAWPSDKISAVFLRSEVPAHWLKSGECTTPDVAAQSLAKWEGERKAGAFRFILTRGTLAWGGPMLIAMYVVPALVKGQAFSSSDLLFNLVLWTVAGAVFGAFIWYNSESNYQKLKQRRFGPPSQSNRTFQSLESSATDDKLR